LFHNVKKRNPIQKNEVEKSLRIYKIKCEEGGASFLPKKF
jgi:hypothetical protein